MPTILEDERPSATDISLWTEMRWKEIMSHCKSKQKTRIYCFTLRNFAWLGFYVFHVIPEIFTNSVWMLWNISLDYGSYSDSEFKWDKQCFHPISQQAIKTSDGFLHKYRDAFDTFRDQNVIKCKEGMQKSQMDTFWRIAFLNLINYK